MLLARVAPIHSPSSAHSAGSPPHVPVRVVWTPFSCHGTLGPPMIRHKNAACPGGCGLAGTAPHVPALGLGGEWCSVFGMLAPPAVLQSLSSSCIPRIAHCPCDVCPSPLMAEGSFFLLFPPYLVRACCCVCDLRPGSCWVGNPCVPPVFGHKNTARAVIFFSFAAVA